jgi:hypothetical protein
VELVAAAQGDQEALHEEGFREVEAEERHEDGVGSVIEVEEHPEVEVASLEAVELREVRTSPLEAAGLAEGEVRCYGFHGLGSAWTWHWSTIKRVQNGH